MNVVLVDNHQGEGIFPLFKKGSLVEQIKPCQESEYWVHCSINNIQTYIPQSYIDMQNNLIEDYNPTELVVKKDDIVEVLKIVHEWLYVKNKQGDFGWIPSSKTISIIST